MMYFWVGVSAVRKKNKEGRTNRAMVLMVANSANVLNASELLS